MDERRAGTDPLILTLAFGLEDFRFFNEQRRLYFPPERNHIPAHCTLFHKLPSEEAAAIDADLRAVARATAPFRLDVSGLRFLGAGTAYELRSPALMELRRDLVRRWDHWLGRQDQQGFKPHVTIQNKVPPAQARQLHDALHSRFRPWTVEAVGLDLWVYRSGPWEHLQHHAFAAASA